MNKNTLSALHQ